MDLKKIGKALLFPHIAIMIILVPISTVFLIFSMLFVGENSVIAYISYVLSAYTLSIWCVRIPTIIRFFKKFKRENRYAKRWFEDERLRVNVSLYGSLFWNTAYALFQLGLGFIHKSFWFYSLAGYYVCLGVMRFFLARHTTKYKPGERIHSELVKHRACGWLFLLINLALTAIIIFMVRYNRTFIHHEITTIVMALFTFVSFSVAIVGMVKYRKFKSPVYNASKAIALASATVSILTLESTMLTTFGGEISAESNRIMLLFTGIAIALFILTMAVGMIVESTIKLKNEENTESVTNE